MSARAVRRRCARLVDTLPIPHPFDIELLCRRIAADRGRPIGLRAISMPAGGPCGLCLAAAQQDFIFFERNTSRLHQEHITLHELGHLLSGHTAAASVMPEASRLLMPNLDPAVVSQILQRTHYSEQQEQEAETIASLILERANRWRPTSEWEAPPEAADISRRLGRALERPTRQPD